MEDRHQIKPYPLRMPPELRQQLESGASAASRSLHAEIILRLAASVAGGIGSHRLLTDSDIAELLRQAMEP